MLDVALCLTLDHDLRLVFLAAIVCATGSWITFRLFRRGLDEKGLFALGWHFLAATAAGSSIWTTHFISMLAYEIKAPVVFDPVLTIVSLLIAICGSFIAFSLTSVMGRFSFIAGGIVLGFSAAAMHYVGMWGYHISGVVSWDMGYVAASVGISVFAASAAIYIVTNTAGQWRIAQSAGVFLCGIVGLHFTGMTALHVAALLMPAGGEHSDSYLAMALSVALGCFVMAGAGLTSFLIENRTRQDSFRKLHTLAFYDTLTGLANRPNLQARLDEMCQAEGETKREFAFIGMDLDKFKEINDLHGHQAGDLVLQAIGDRLKALQNASIHFARLGGDEFAAIMEISDESALLKKMMEIKQSLTQPIKLDTLQQVSTGVSLGAARYPFDAEEPQELVNRADLAMYRAKHDPLTSICFYDAAMDEVVRRRKALTADLRQAIAHDELELHYQVQTTVATGAISGFEVLLRWKHPERGYIPPSEFIPLAEASGFIMELGLWVLKTACRQAAQWPNLHKIAVNLSPMQLADPFLPERVQESLAESGLAASRLELELTESAVVENRERTLDLLSRIKALGVTIALDDFGTGYSSLETLRSFPFDKIKLDRSFMHEIEDSAESRAIVRAVLALGRSLNVPVLAEGVETRHQLDILNSEGCDAAQGYFLGRPTPIARLLESFHVAADASSIDFDVAILQSVGMTLRGSNARRESNAATINARQRGAQS
ncbi:bifunctional diguanylate cyclase/phosphodiesterase [Rhizobium sp. L1K21]|uniref:putative bifunctional diguanylate cyclase/phosphodiesterase n=1 Tax=Rhizobium sp. L1K21 TaxID=2954933 RepID=UPI00209202A6|nr:bifunctional diguanylate cyclase/phosphodiesterase [Rhizobium sp. L1K21]MCO6185546.1 bifunctional diguanylate cyclase/phosphodiesterase [Rhizobium sp. L1K21]